MLNTQETQQGRVPLKVSSETFSGINKHDSIGKLDVGECLDLVNVDIEDGYIVERKGTRLTSRLFDCKTRVHASICFVSAEADNTEVVLMELESDNKNGHYYGDRDTDYVKTWDGLSKFETGNTKKHNYVYASGKVYMFDPAGNYIFELVEIDSGASFIWDQYEWRAREIGIPSLQITDIQQRTGSTTEIPEGTYGYALEAIRKKDGTSIPIASSSPNRFFKTPAAGSTWAEATIPTGTYEYLDPQFLVSDAVALATAGVVTHIRLWRTKNQDYNITTSTTDGSRDEWYLIDEITIAEAQVDNSIGATGHHRFVDYRKDTEIPDIYSAENLTLVATDDYNPFEMEPIPAAYVGTYYKDRVWAGHFPEGTTGRVNDASNIIRGGYAGTIYNELYSPSEILACESGDGFRITKMQGMSGHMIVFKENSTGYIENSDIFNGYEIIDAGLGISFLNAGSYLTRRGMMGVTNDRDRIMMFGENLQWTEYIGSVNFSEKIEGSYSVTIPDELNDTLVFKAVYWEGKLIVHVGESRILHVFHLATGHYWTTYNIPLGSDQENEDDEVSNIECLFTRRGGRDCALSVYNNPATTTADDSGLIQFITDRATELSTDQITATTLEKIAFKITPRPFQNDEGRNLIEQRYLSVMAAICDPLKVSVSVCNALSEVATEEPVILETPTCTVVPAEGVPRVNYVDGTVVNGILVDKIVVPDATAYRINFKIGHYTENTAAVPVLGGEGVATGLSAYRSQVVMDTNGGSVNLSNQPNSFNIIDTHPIMMYSVICDGAGEIVLQIDGVEVDKKVYLTDTGFDIISVMGWVDPYITTVSDTRWQSVEVIVEEETVLSIGVTADDTIRDYLTNDTVEGVEVTTSTFIDDIPKEETDIEVPDPYVIQQHSNDPTDAVSYIALDKTYSAPDATPWTFQIDLPFARYAGSGIMGVLATANNSLYYGTGVLKLILNSGEECNWSSADLNGELNLWKLRLVCDGAGNITLYDGLKQWATKTATDTSISLDTVGNAATTAAIPGTKAIGSDIAFSKFTVDGVTQFALYPTAGNTIYEITSNSYPHTWVEGATTNPTIWEAKDTSIPNEYIVSPGSAAYLQAQPFTVDFNAVIEYQYYAEDKYPQVTRIFGERLIHTIEGAGRLQMYPPVLYAFVNYNNRKPGYNFTEAYGSRDDIRYMDLGVGMIVHATRTDITTNLPDGRNLPVLQLE